MEKVGYFRKIADISELLGVMAQLKCQFMYHEKAKRVTYIRDFGRYFQKKITHPSPTSHIIAM